MTPLTCAATRRRLQAFHDGELPVPDQIAVAAHLEWCDECAAQREEMRALGVALRMALPGRVTMTRDEQATFPGAVANRQKVEQSASWPARLRQMFDDAHIMYAGAAAAVAAIVCVVVTIGMMRAANGTPRPDSLAWLIGILSPGSNQNPVVPRPNVLPRSLDHIAFSTTAGLNDEAVFMLSATVTREGRVENLELLSQTGEEATRSTNESKALASLLDAVSRARFEPASVAGLPVAVNMVWMVAHTTVRGTPQLPGPPRIDPPVKKRRIAASPELPGGARSHEAVIRHA